MGGGGDPVVIHYQPERSAACLLSNGPSVGGEVEKAGGRRQRQQQTKKRPNFNSYLAWDRIATYRSRIGFFSQNSDVSTGELKQETTVTLQSDTEHYHIHKCFRWMLVVHNADRN